VWLAGWLAGWPCYLSMHDNFIGLFLWPCCRSFRSGRPSCGFDGRFAVCRHFNLGMAGPIHHRHPACTVLGFRGLGFGFWSGFGSGHEVNHITTKPHRCSPIATNAIRTAAVPFSSKAIEAALHGLITELDLCCRYFRRFGVKRRIMIHGVLENSNENRQRETLTRWVNISIGSNFSKIYSPSKMLYFD